MTFRFIDGHRHLWPVRVLCDALGVAASLIVARVEKGRGAP